jgi:hypothetical protein
MRVKPEQASKVTTRMPTLRPFGEGCTSGEVIDTRTRSIRRGSGRGTLERWFGKSGETRLAAISCGPVLDQRDQALSLVCEQDIEIAALKARLVDVVAAPAADQGNRVRSCL